MNPVGHNNRPHYWYGMGRQDGAASIAGVGISRLPIEQLTLPEMSDIIILIPYRGRGYIMDKGFALPHLINLF